MALKTGYMFSSFSYQRNGKRLRMNAPLTIFTYKGDNNATSVKITTIIDGANPFQYKYITFDEETFFEITNIVKNNNNYTVFYRYLTHVPLGVATDFEITRQTPATLSSIPFSLSQIIEAIGTRDIIKTHKTTDSAIKDWGYFIKVELSEMPQNLSRFEVKPDGTLAKISAGFSANTRGFYGYLTQNNEEPQQRFSIPNPSLLQGTQSSVSILIPVPMRSASDLMSPRGQFKIGSSYTFNLTYMGFINTLRALISDLTLNIKIIPCSLDETGIIAIKIVNGVTTINNVNYSDGVYTMQNANLDTFLFGVWDNSLCCVSDIDTGTTPYPIMILQTGLGGREKTAGFGEVYNFRRLPRLRLKTNQKEYMLHILGNSIELNELPPERYIYIKTMPDGLRIYLNYSDNDFIDFPNDVEFDKSAFSNYGAYIKSNVEISNKQAIEQLRLQQKYDEKNYWIKQGQTLFSGIESAVTRAAVGNIAAGISAGVNTVSSWVFNGVENELNKSQQNAQNELNAAQALEKARAQIVPGTTLNGAIKLEDILYCIENDGDYIKTPYYYDIITLTDNQIDLLYEKLIIENHTQIISNYVPIHPDYISSNVPFLCYFDANWQSNNISFYALTVLFS